MLICPHCKNELPDDSQFCAVCGKSLTKKQHQSTAAVELKENIHKNVWSYLGLLAFFIGLFGFDFILATVFNAFLLDYKIIFYISTAFYLIAMLCAIMSLVTDYRAKRNGYQPNGNTTVSLAVMVINFYVCLVNVQHVFF